MGCAASHPGGVAPSSQERRNVYERFLLEEDEFGEFGELGCADVTSGAFCNRMPVAPYSFSRPSSDVEPSPRIPCFDEEQLLALKDAPLWAARGKRRQLFYAMSHHKNHRRWAYFNDSLDLVCTVKYIFAPEVAASAEQVRIVTSSVVRRVTSDAFVSFVATILPLQTTTTVDIPSSVPEDHFFVTYDADGVEAFPDLVQREKDRGQKLWETDADDVAQAVRASANGSDNAVTEAELVLGICVERNIAFVDTTMKPDLAEPCFRPSSILLPLEADEVRLFRSSEEAVRNTRKLLCSGGAKYYHQADAVFMICSHGSEYVKRIFRHPKHAAQGLLEHQRGGYRATLSPEWWRMTVVVDNFFPTCGGKYIGLSREDPCEVWPQVLSRALKKCFSSIEDVNLQTLVSSLTGALVRRQNWLSSDDGNYAVCNQLHKWIDKEHLVGFSSTEAGSSRIAATLIGVLHFPSKGIALLNLRIPSWHAPDGALAAAASNWNESSSRWEEHPEIANACNFQNWSKLDPSRRSDIFVDVSEARRLFPSLLVCYSGLHCHDYRVKGAFVGIVPSVCLQIHAARRLDVFLTLGVVGPPSHRVLISVLKRLAPQPRADGGTTLVGGIPQYVVLANSTCDPEDPSPTRFSFVDNACGMRVRLEAGTSYLLVPRLLQSDEGAASLRAATHGLPRMGDVTTSGLVECVPEVPFVIALNSDVSCTRQDGVHAVFVRLDGDCKIFQNVLSTYVGSGVCKPTEALAQTFTAGVVNEYLGGELD